MTESLSMGRPRTVLHLVNCLRRGGAELQMLEFLRGINRKRYRPLVGCLVKEGNLLEELEKLKIPVIEVPVRPKLYSPKSILSMRSFTRILREERVEIIHTQDLYSHLVGIPTGRLAGVKGVIVGRLDLCHFYGLPHRAFLRLLSNFATVNLANSEAVRQMLVKTERISPKKVEVIYNGVNLERFDRCRAGRPPFGLRGSEPVVGIIANLNPVKGHVYFLEAAARVARRVSQVRFLLIGDGVLRPDLEVRAEQLGIADRVVFAGSRQDIPYLLKWTDVVVLSSLAEGFSNAVLEGMAAGKPVVATRVGGNAEAVVEGETGFIVPPRNADALADRILLLLGDEEVSRRMGDAGRRRIEKLFSVDRMISDTEALYDRILSRRDRQEREGR